MLRVIKALPIVMIFLALIGLCVGTIAHAQEAVAAAVTPEQDIGAILLQLATNYKSLSPLALGVLGVNLVLGILKSDAFGNVFKKLDPLLKMLIITILGQVVGILTQITAGKSVAQAIVFGLVTSGGAVAIYEAYNLFKKQAAKVVAK